MNNEEYFFKKTKTNGITYLKIFRKLGEGRSEYVRMAGSARALAEKLKRLEELEKQDQEIKPFLDQIRKRETGS